MNPLCHKVKSHVKDSTHFLQIIEDLRDIPANCHLVTLDVCSLYTNIPDKQSKEAVKANLESNRPQTGVNSSNKPLMELLNLILTKNNFQFNGHHYIQIKGVSMGSRVSPSLAILYMCWVTSKKSMCTHTTYSH